MKHILVIGAGKSATCLIEYLVKETALHNWKLTVADGNLALAASKTGQAAHTQAIELNVEAVFQRQQLIQSADIVISLLPPALHFLVAEDCVRFGKHLLTASYIDDKIASLKQQIIDNDLLFLCEMGLDPGIDHMSAMQLIHEIQHKGGTITSFRSHCGGLVAPESDDNPWHYKISWNPRNVVMAGKAGATYRENGVTIHKSYTELFDKNEEVTIPGPGQFAYYPNRDSLGYIPVYQLESAQTFLRTTLRYPSFCTGWKQLIALQLTDETLRYDTNDMSLQHFFATHFQHTGATEKIAQLRNATSKEDQAFLGQLIFLGLDDSQTIINKGKCSAADVLLFILEQKLVLRPDDKDMVVMLHEIGYELNGQAATVNSSLVVKGEDQLRTAMAKTVGLPLGIAAKLIAEGKIQLKGLHIPILPGIYEPVLQELREQGIIFHEA